MKKFLIILLVVFLSLAAYLYKSFLLQQKTLIFLQKEKQKITAYSTWGFDTKPFEKIYEDLIIESKGDSIIVFPFRVEYFQKKQANIINLIQTAYATEVTKQKGLVQSRLSYLRDRIKGETVLTQEKKKAYSDIFEVVAGEIFVWNSDLNALKKALLELNKQDSAITKEVEAIRKESLIHELENYKASCQELLSYFIEKKSEPNQALAIQCIAAADTLLGPRYKENGADFIETLSRERVFTFEQQAIQAKQKMEQDELYAQAVKKKEEERLTLVPPAPRQEGKVIVVNIGLQRLYAYTNGSPLFAQAVPITTGKYGFETVTGEFAIYLKELQHKMSSPFPGIYYDDVVNYWMPFYLGYGLHDAPWRSVYGTMDYSSIGSHGCVNIPLQQTSILYNWAEVGTRVIVL